MKYVIQSKLTGIPPYRSDCYWVNVMTIENPPHTSILSLQGALHSPNLSTLGAYT